MLELESSEPDPELPDPEPELDVPESSEPDPELPDPEPELDVPESSEPDPELPDPEPELDVPESSEPDPELPDPEPELDVPESSEPDPELPDPEPELPEPEPELDVPEFLESSPRSMVVSGPMVTVRSTGAVVVVAVVVGGVVVDLGTVGGAGSGSVGEAGLRHTDAEVGAPRFGNRLSRIAYTAPADPTTTTNATMANDTGAASQALREPAPAPSTSRKSDGVRANTVARRDPSAPCPRSSQSSLTVSTLPRTGHGYHQTMVVVPGSDSAARHVRQTGEFSRSRWRFRPG